MAGEHTLYLVATPIGHLDDIGLRAIETLKDVTRIYAEDTRHSAGLLRRHGIATPLVALHEHNERDQAARIARRVQQDGSAALISDAGTPAISDPGYRLVRACIDAGVAVSPVPGASALLAALVVSGLPTDRFEFAGFAPSKRGARRDWLVALSRLEHTLLLYESPHRIEAALGDIVDMFGADRPLVLARELTKRFETVLRGTASEVLERVAGDADQRRGEFVIVIGAAPATTATYDDSSGIGGDAMSIDALLRGLSPHLPPKTVARIVADLVDQPKRAIYQRLLSLVPESTR